MLKKTVPKEVALKATENLRPYFEESEQKRKNGFPFTVPSESPHLNFFEPLWEQKPRDVYAQNGEFVIGTVLIKSKELPHQSGADRVGIWNAATGELVFQSEGALSIAWTPDFSQIGVWREYYVPNPSISDFFKGNVRSEWHWRFERWQWATKNLISSCDIASDDMWASHMEFPKKYKGRIAKLHCRYEDGGENIFVLCNDKDGDREISSKEMADIRKLK